MPAVDAAPAHVVESFMPAPVGNAVRELVDEYIALELAAHAVYAAPAPVVENIAPAPAVSYVPPVPMVDVLGPLFHENIAETSCKATSSGDRVRKSARLSPIELGGIRI